MDPFIGQIQPFGFNFAPRGWAFCEGQLLAIAQNSALFSLLGTTYGGDGRTTYGLPDLRGRSMMQFGQGPGLPNYRWGQKGGAPTVTLTTAEMPSHSHVATIQAGSGTSTTGAAGGNVLGTETRSSADVPDIYVSGASPNVAMHPSTASITNTGNNQAHENMSPYLAVSICIALVGVYPSRN